MKDSILVLTSARDKSVDNVIDMLKLRGEKVFRLNTEEFPTKNSLVLQLNNGLSSNRIATPEWKLSTDDIKSCWYRHVDPSIIASKCVGSAKFSEKESTAALWSLYTSIDAFWMNHPLIGVRLLESNKLYQLNAATKVGLRIPDTLITNNAEEVMAFTDSHGGEIAAKVLTGHIFSVSGADKIQTIYTQRISKNVLEKLSATIGLAPIFIEEYVHKKIELRVTVVEERIFACAIRSQDSPQTKDDWRRYDFDNVAHTDYKLSDDISAKIIALMKRLGLTYGAIDMIVTPQEDYIFLEVNPSGQWAWIEHFTGMKISEAVAASLANAGKR